ncbi:MAG: MFS transporter [Gammaproteobacteria bacterium]|jgi:MFS family permease|nr:MFS transporter [Gammaproteobacteria bacterium]
MNDNTANEQLNKNITVFTLIVTGAMGVMAFQVLPSLVIGMITELEFNQQQVGRVASAQLGGIAIGSFLNLWLIKIMSWRRIAYFGLTCLLITDIVSMFVTDYSAFVLIRLLSGSAGGICVSFGAYALGSTLKADRNFGLFLSVQVISAIVANMFLPGIVQANGVISIFIALVILELLILFLLIHNIPNLDVQDQQARGVNSRKVWVYCILQLVAVLFFFTALGGFWSNIASIGLDAGLSEQQTGRAISLGLFGGLAGAFVAAHLNIRLGRLFPVLLALGSQFVALAILYSGFQFTVFMLAAGLFMFGWYMFFPYQLGLLAAMDRDGRPMILANAVAGIGSGIGPLILSFYLVDDFLPAYTITAMFLALALVLTVLIILISKAELKSA